MLYVPLLLKIKSSKTAADTFRSNPDFKVDEAITELGVGEALISCLDEQGTPQIVERGWVMPPFFYAYHSRRASDLNLAKYYCRGL